MTAASLSIVVPAYNEAESVKELSQWISRVMKSHGFPYEIVFVDDGSTDGTFEKIREAKSEDPSIKGLRFESNHGKSAALNAAFKECNGEVVATMDADLQDSPEELPELRRMILEDDWHIVSGWKKKRHDPLSKTIPSRLFNFTTRLITGIRLHDFNCGLKAYRAEVVKNVHIYGEMHRYIPVIAKWQGYDRITEKVVEHFPRKFGKTKFGMERFINGFLDLISVTFVTRYIKRPMHFFGTLGIISFLVGVVFTGKIIWDKVDAIYLSKVPVQREVTEQPLFFLALAAIIIGVQLFLAGFIGEMLAQRRADKEEAKISERV